MDNDSGLGIGDYNLSLVNPDRTKHDNNESFERKPQQPIQSLQQQQSNIPQQ